MAPSLDREHAYIAFEKTLVTLHYQATESSILVTIDSDGRNGAAAAVTDRLRVLILEELSAYVHLRHKLLALVPDGRWVDIDELPKARAGPSRKKSSVGLLGQQDLVAAAARAEAWKVSHEPRLEAEELEVLNRGSHMCATQCVSLCIC